MKKKLVVWSCKLIGLTFIFIAPISYLIWKYSKKIVVEETHNSIPLLILAPLSIIIIIGISYAFSQLRNYIKEKPFGFASIYFVGILIGTISFLAHQWINKIIDLLNANTARFLTDLDIYKGSMRTLMVYISIGLIMTTLGLVLDKTME